MNRFIDPPDLLSGTLQDWQNWLAELKSIEPKDDDIRAAIAEAEAVISDKIQPR